MLPIVRLLLLLVCISGNAFCADISDYFKKVTYTGNPLLDQNKWRKSQRHSMKNIDFIYMINLDQRPEKFSHCVKELKPYGIRPFRFSAVNGWELYLQDINNLGVKYNPSTMQGGQMATTYLAHGNLQQHHEIMNVSGRTYFGHCLSRGAIGIVLSHLSILQDALDKGYETIWIMEDDIEVIRSPRLLPKLIDKLDALVGKNEWDFLFTDRDTKGQDGNYVPCLGYAWRPNFTPLNPAKFYLNKQISPDFRKIGARYGAYSMIVRRSGMKKILNFFKKYHIYLPYDMDFYLPPNINCYTVVNDVISTLPKAISDNGKANYLKK